MKNKAPAPVQITAEQLLREAKERQLELVPPVRNKALLIRGNAKNKIYLYPVLIKLLQIHKSVCRSLTIHR